MVEASVSRTVGNIGEYILYDIGQGIGLAATYLVSGTITGAGWGNQSQNGTYISLGAAAVFFYLSASVIDNPVTGDMMATATLGAILSAVLWHTGVEMPDETFEDPPEFFENIRSFDASQSKKRALP